MIKTDLEYIELFCWQTSKKTFAGYEVNLQIIEVYLN